MRPGDDVFAALEHCREAVTSARRLYVGFSGGLDSTVLLHATHTLLPGVPIALHAHHGLHGDADRWQQHCRDWCDERGIELRSRALTVRREGRGLEAAARESRLAWFEEQIGDEDLLLLAHHQDDQAETLLLRLLRGAGPTGLGAMARTRGLGKGALLRPFLDLPRGSLVAYAQERGLAWVEDPSNDDDAFDRNYLRRRVMPLLEERWPGCRRSIARAARLLREESREPAFDAPPTVTSVAGDPGFPLASLPSRPAAAAVALRAWLRERGLQGPPEARLTEFLRQLRDGAGATLKSGDWVLSRFGGSAFLYPDLEAVEDFELPIAIGERRHIPGVGTVVLEGPGHGAGGADRPVRLLLRARRGGERLRSSAGRRRVKKLLQELRVPPWWRERLPLLFEGDADGGELIAVGPFAASPRLAELGLRLRWEPPGLNVP